jgi:hypothetical protein
VRVMRDSQAMKRTFVPTRSATDWQRLLAKPDVHWKQGSSAMTAAVCWEAAEGSLPPEIARLLDGSADPLLVGQRLVVAFPEWSTALPGGVTTSQTDVLAVCRNDRGLCVIGVEAKVLEPFGPLVAVKRVESASSGQVERLEYLHELLGVDHFDDQIRYQLLHRTASALLAAREFHSAAAVMLVHAFDTPADRRSDFEAFRLALGADEVALDLYRVALFEQPVLFLAWCDGDSSFLKMAAT